MTEKIKNFKHRIAIIKQLRDPRVIGLLLFGVLVLMVSWSGIGAIQTNYELQKQIAEQKQENNVRQLENNNLKLRNQYYDTNQFLELAARRQFGKGAPGEKLILVPKNIALAHTIDTPAAKTKSITARVSTPRYQQNFQAWLDFFMHRQADNLSN